MKILGISAHYHDSAAALVIASVCLVAMITLNVNLAVLYFSLLLLAYIYYYLGPRKAGRPKDKYYNRTAEAV